MDSLLDQVGAVVAGVFDNPAVRLVLSLAVAYITILWLASAWWALQDMRRRHADPALPYVAAAGVILASPLLFPLALVVYRIVRPGRTLAEARELFLTERLEALDADGALSCPGCSNAVEEDWLLCPNCRTRLAHRCASCSRTMALDWTLCGWCGAEFGRPVLPERLPRHVPVATERIPMGPGRAATVPAAAGARANGRETARRERRSADAGAEPRGGRAASAGLMRRREARNLALDPAAVRGHAIEPGT